MPDRALLWIACAALVLCAVLAPTHAKDREARAEDLKAAVLFRAAKYIEWPKSAFRPRDPFVMCIVGDGSSLRAFDALRSTLINTRTVNVRRVTGDMAELRKCHVAFFPLDTDANVVDALGKLAGMPVLTAGETRGFVQSGGMLALIPSGHRVRFAINLPAAKRAGLTVSSQLLQLAKVTEASP